MSRKPQRRRGQRPTRLSDSTRAKLDEIKARSLRHFSSYDALIDDLADKALSGRGYPLNSREAASRIKATGALRVERSGSSEAPESRAMAS